MAAAVRILLWGASGRMGHALVREIAGREGVGLAGGVASKGNPQLGSDLGELAQLPPVGVRLAAEPPAVADWDLVIDFSLPSSRLAAVRLAAEQGKPAVVGTTGLDEGQHAELRRLAERTAVLQAANFSLGVALMARLTAQALPAARAFGAEAELVEKHHSGKKDSPSGTALALAERMGLQEDAIRSLREGDVRGEHGLLLRWPDEVLEIKHEALSRSCFATGAVTAALWLRQQASGLYGMDDCL